MKFIKKKNLLDGEELLYTPNLHWMYIIKQVAQFLLLIPVLLIIWAVILSIGLMDLMQFFGVNIGYMILTIAIIACLILIWRIFLYLSTEYGVTNKRLIMKRGIIRVVVAEIPTDRIESIYCLQGILGRIFNYGTICISGIGGMMPVFYMVCKPYSLRRKIVRIIEKNKTITVIHGDLPKIEPIVKPAPVVEEEPLHRYGTFVRVLTDTKQQEA